MLKKIFSIFFILCLVVSLTVPCFAQDIRRPVYYNQLAHDVVLSTRGSATVDQDGLYTISDTSRANGINVNIGSTLYIDHLYLIIFRIDFTTSHIFRVSSTTGSNFLLTSYEGLFVCTFFTGSNISTFQLRDYGSNNLPISFYFHSVDVVDLTAIYDDPSSVTFDQFFTDFPFFLDRSVSYTQSTFYNPDISSGFSKLLSFSHVFDRFPYFFDQYTTVTVWIVGSVSVSIIILIIVFMIKRFSGGRS